MVVLQGHPHNKAITGFKGAQYSEGDRVLHVVGHKTIHRHHVCKGVGSPGIDHRYIHTLSLACAARTIARIEGCYGDPGGRRRRRLVDNSRLDELWFSAKRHALNMHHADQTLCERIIGGFVRIRAGRAEARNGHKN